MRKFIFLFLLINLCVFSKEMILSQNDLKLKLSSSLEKSTIFKKFKPVFARKAKIGEVIYTYTSDGLETKNPVTEEGFVVKNNTKAKEIYFLKKANFLKKYSFSKKLDSTWSVYLPLNKIKAIKVKNKTPFYIIAPWGEKMIVKENDFLVSPINSDEIYRIANKEFFETYK